MGKWSRALSLGHVSGFLIDSVQFSLKRQEGVPSLSLRALAWGASLCHEENGLAVLRVQARNCLELLSFVIV